jgi:hypothetical protein
MSTKNREVLSVKCPITELRDILNSRIYPYNHDVLTTTCSPVRSGRTRRQHKLTMHNNKFPPPHTRGSLSITVGGSLPGSLLR